MSSAPWTKDWHRVARRLHHLPEAMAGHRRSLRAGIAARNTPALRQVRDVAAQAAEVGAADGYFTRLAAPASGRVPPALWSDLASGAQATAGAYADLAAFPVRDLAPHAPRHHGVGRGTTGLPPAGSSERAPPRTTPTRGTARNWPARRRNKTAREIKPGASVEEAAALLDARASPRATPCSPHGAR
ncbi:DUF885 family protein [Streptomyces sp. NPDC004629]|uniref:DUF885 family protein n=1 Tax=Streptomyces sp. NPDC004629 TaxID=3364705 RepID=UPI0036A0FB46